MRSLRSVLLLVALGAGLATAQTSSPKHVDVPVVAPRADDVATIDGMIRAWYEVVSVPAGRQPDWGRDRSLYIPDLRFVVVGVENGKPYARTLSHQSYVDREDAALSKGFFEREIHRVTERFGSIAHVWSTYESRATENGPVTARGINSIELFWDGSRWWIANGIWTEETKDNPIPPAFLPGLSQRGSPIPQ
jgi:hypothetical protein